MKEVIFPAFTDDKIAFADVKGDCLVGGLTRGCKRSLLYNMTTGTYDWYDVNELVLIGGFTVQEAIRKSKDFSYTKFYVFDSYHEKYTWLST